MIDKFEGAHWKEVKRDKFLQQREDAQAALSLGLRGKDRHVRFITSAVGANIVITNNSDNPDLAGLPFFVGPGLFRKDEYMWVSFSCFFPSTFPDPHE